MKLLYIQCTLIQVHFLDLAILLLGGDFLQLKKINVNPAKRNTDDSYVKVLTIALNISYKKAYKLLAEYGMQQCLSMNDSRLFRNFRKSI